MKEIIGSIAVVLTFLAYIPYYKDILKGKTQPHIYTWSLWGILTVLLVALQIKGGAGSASWVTAAAGLMCFGVIFLSLKNGKRNITTSDTVVSVLSLMSIGFWLFANQPEVSISLIIIADLFAFVPTVRKSYKDPYSETLSFYVTNVIRFCLALIAVEHYTYLSSSWIIAWVLGNALLSIMLIIRRKQLKNE